MLTLDDIGQQMWDHVTSVVPKLVLAEADSSVLSGMCYWWSRYVRAVAEDEFSKAKQAWELYARASKLFMGSIRSAAVRSKTCTAQKGRRILTMPSIVSQRI